MALDSSVNSKPRFLLLASSFSPGPACVARWPRYTHVTGAHPQEPALTPRPIRTATEGRPGPAKRRPSPVFESISKCESPQCQCDRSCSPECHARTESCTTLQPSLLQAWDVAESQISDVSRRRLSLRSSWLWVEQQRPQTAVARSVVESWRRTRGPTGITTRCLSSQFRPRNRVEALLQLRGHACKPQRDHRYKTCCPRAGYPPGSHRRLPSVTKCWPSVVKIAYRSTCLFSLPLPKIVDWGRQLLVLLEVPLPSSLWLCLELYHASFVKTRDISTPLARCYIYSRIGKFYGQAHH